MCEQAECPYAKQMGRDRPNCVWNDKVNRCRSPDPSFFYMLTDEGKIFLVDPDEENIRRKSKPHPPLFSRTNRKITLSIYRYQNGEIGSEHCIGSIESQRSLHHDVRRPTRQSTSLLRKRSRGQTHVETRSRSSRQSSHRQRRRNRRRTDVGRHLRRRRQRARSHQSRRENVEDESRFGPVSLLRRSRHRSDVARRKDVRTIEERRLSSRSDDGTTQFDSRRAAQRSGELGARVHVRRTTVRFRRKSTSLRNRFDQSARSAYYDVGCQRASRLCFAAGLLERLFERREREILCSIYELLRRLVSRGLI